MTWKKLLTFVIATALAPQLFAQTIEEKLAKWSQANTIEKLYVHLDRESFFSGQTIWLKGYFMSEYVPSIKNSSMYVELLDNNSTVVRRKVFPTYMGVTMGQVEIPETLPSGSYQLRAFAPLMLNQPGFVFNKRIEIFGAPAKDNKKAQKEAATDLQFFPEGGNMATTLLNNIAFKAVDQNGYPVAVSGQVKNNKGEAVTDFSSQHDGMGLFSLVPQEGETYFVVLDNNPGKQYNLPASVKDAITFSVRNSSKGKQFKIEIPKGLPPQFRPAYMIGQAQNQVLFKQPFQEGKDLIGGVIQVNGVLSGILQLTVFNKDGMPLAERITFINNKEYVLPGTLTIDTLNTTAHQRNHFSLHLKDTVIGNFSVSVTDADFENGTERPLNIYSYFLLNSDVKGYVHNPSWYFQSDADSVKNSLDLVMMTNGWTRFKWDEVIKNTLPVNKYNDPGYIRLAGRANIEGTRKPFANKDLMLMTRPVDTLQGKGGLMKLIQTDSLGNFRIDSQILYDRNRILFSDIKGKKSKFIKIKMDADSLTRMFPLTTEPIPYEKELEANNEIKMLEAYNDYTKAEGLTLNNVTVKARSKNESEKFENEYTSGMFSGGINSRFLDLRNENAGAMNIFDYIQGRLPGVTVSRDNEGQYVVKYRDGGFGNGKMTLYLDEMPTDATFIESIPINQIAGIKLMGNFVGAPGGGGALAIYMKKGADLNAAIESSTDIISYNGYSIIKQFYSPNYETGNVDASKPDNRLTLLWQPDLYLANINPKVPIIFYNNDRTKKFKVVVEGVTNDGRLLMIEKIIDVPK